MMAQTAAACDMHRTLFPFFRLFSYFSFGRANSSGNNRENEGAEICRVAIRQSPGESSFFFRIKKGHRNSSMQMLIIGRRRRRGECLCTCPLLLSFVNKRIIRREKINGGRRCDERGPGPTFSTQNLTLIVITFQMKKKPLLPHQSPSANS